jgi:hypothetical protein
LSTAGKPLTTSFNGGIPITVVSRHLGHENIQITVDTYGDVDRSSSRAAADFMARTLKPPPEGN